MLPNCLWRHAPGALNPPCCLSAYQETRIMAGRTSAAQNSLGNVVHDGLVNVASLEVFSRHALGLTGDKQVIELGV